MTVTNADPDLSWSNPPSRASALLFQAKVAAFQMRRAVIDLAAGLKRLEASPAPDGWVVVGESRTELWSEERSREHRHQRGKVENLRRAAQAIGGGRLPAGQVFSFWRHVGRASRRRGFVAGRMLQEGCLVPAVGGGLCQMSNGLYEAALQSGCEIVERHAHSKVVPGSAATTGRDATVAWNYVDLRFRSTRPLHLSATVQEDELVVRFLAPPDQKAAATAPDADPERATANACDSCNATDCFRHQPRVDGPALAGRRVWLVDENWPEFRTYLAANRTADDTLGLPLDGGRWKLARYDWPTEGVARVGTASLAALARTAAIRRNGDKGPARRRAELHGAAKVAEGLGRLLTPDDLDVVVAQSLLPALWASGRLGGRRFSVLMTRLPMTALQDRLDAAFALYPDQASLADFRADPALIAAEAEALAQAHRLITPHAAIARLFPGRAELIGWTTPPARERSAPAGRRIAFPGPTASRKGAALVRETARALDLEVVLPGSELEGPSFWDGVRTLRPKGDWLEGVAAVVQPAVVEDCPRRLLAALAAGVPVVATSACGISPRPGLTIVPVGDQAALTRAVEGIVAQIPSPLVGEGGPKGRMRGRAQDQDEERSRP